MKKQVKTIPAKINQITKKPIGDKKKRKVVAYARVSTDSEEQATSYEAQMDYYKEYILGRSDWEYCGLYSDEGITGTNTKKREGFKRMVADAKDGKFDLIITKSVSRFARNTVDSLTTVRELKEKGIEIYFEKENIWTLDSKGELLITIMSSLAQEESRSISENCIWGQRKRFADGKVTVPFSQFLGYDRGEDGNLIINEKEAEIVRYIYALFLEGETPGAIAKKLTKKGIETPGHKKKWSRSTVTSILTNEKYKGDALLQKSFTTNFLTKEKKKNEGEIPQYYVEDNHEAIIDRELFDFVQAEMKRIMNTFGRHARVGLFAGKMKCEKCGHYFGRKTWHSTSKYKRQVYQCNGRNHAPKCRCKHYYEDDLKDRYLEAVGKILKTKKRADKDLARLRETVFDTTELKSKEETLINEAEVVANMIDELIRENSRKAKDQDKYNKQYSELSERYEKLEQEIYEVRDEIESKENRLTEVEYYVKKLKEQGEKPLEFTPLLFHSLVELVLANDERITFQFRDGTKVETIR